MIIEKTVGNVENIDLGKRTKDVVFADWYELEKKLLRKTSKQGEEIGIRLSERLKDGDILYMDEERAIVIEVLPCDLTVVSVNSLEQMGRLCFELGNRHLPVSIQTDQVAFCYDEPTFRHLENLGFAPQKSHGKFTNITVCHAHDHHSSQKKEK